jgi:hypothetical protein
MTDWTPPLPRVNDPWPAGFEVARVRVARDDADPRRWFVSIDFTYTEAPR